MNLLFMLADMDSMFNSLMLVLLLLHMKGILIPLIAFVVFSVALYSWDRYRQGERRRNAALSGPAPRKTVD